MASEGNAGEEVSNGVPIMKSPEMQKLKEKRRTAYKKQKILLKLYLQFSAKQNKQKMKNFLLKNTFKYKARPDIIGDFYNWSTIDECIHN